jgi:hypothetical protein
MAISAEEREQVMAEVKRFATSLNLTDDQKQKLESALTEGREKLQTYRQQNPNASKEDIVRRVAEHRTSIRERVVNFLNPQQLQTWDAEVANAKEFLGQRMAA